MNEDERKVECRLESIKNLLYNTTKTDWQSRKGAMKRQE
jgi:hypothetical protein